MGRPVAVLLWLCFSLNVASPLASKVISPYVPSTAGVSFTLKLNSLSVLSLGVELVTDFVTSRSPVLRVLVKAAEALTVLIVPSITPSEGVTVNPASDASVTVYLMPVGIPLMVLVSPFFRVNVAVPFVNDTPPKVPLTAWSSFSSFTVNSKFLFASVLRLLNTVFVTSRSPVSLVFSNSAEDFVVEIVPSAFSLTSPFTFVSLNPSAAVSVTSYAIPTGSPLMVFVWPPLSFMVAFPFSKVTPPYVLLTAGVSCSVNSNS